MATEANMISRGLIEVDRGGEVFLGVDTGIGSNSPTLRKLAGQKRQHGWIVREGSIEEWRAIGFIEHDGRVHVYGPLHRGRFFEDALTDPDRDRLSLLADVASSIERMRADGLPIAPFHTRSLVVLDDGGLLALPPDIAQAIREHQDYAARIERMERFNHPDRSPEENVPFALAAAAYFVITGRFPYDSEDEEDLHARVRSATMTPPRFVDVTIRDEVSETLTDALTTSEPGRSAGDWASILRRWSSEGVRTEITPEEHEKRRASAEQAVARLEKGFRRRESVRKNGRKALIIAAIVIVVGSIPATIIRNALQPRATAGLPAEEVVRVFYTSIGTLDHMTMEDAVVDDAGRDLIREVTNLFVLDRQRMSVEMQSGFVDAEQWRSEGMPELPPGRTPYGVANLEIVSLSAPEEERRYEVRYERWLPDYERAEQTGMVGVAGYRVEDIVSLRLDGEDWVIYEIARRSQEPIDVSELRASLSDQ
ncbi:MAG: hypothetical protein ACOC0O_01750 [Spirochaetota bacterium]